MLHRGLILAIVAFYAGCAPTGLSQSEAQQPAAAPLAVVATERERGIGDFPKLTADDWPWWRGPTRNGIAAETPAPTFFSDQENVIWKTPLPGRGHSSPTIIGDRVYLATSEEPAQVQSVLAFDRRDGKPLWKTVLNTGGYAAAIHGNNTHASPTIACDGERLYAVFPHHDEAHATALEFDGKVVWQKSVAPFRPQRYEYGFAPSPVIYQKYVIITTEFDGPSAITALDRTTGEIAWKVERPENISFSTPNVVPVGGRDQLVISGYDQIASYDPRTGRPLWSAAGNTVATCGTVVWDGDVILASGGYPRAETTAVLGDGSAKVLWKNPQKCYEQSMIAYQGHLYALTDNGVLYCWRVSDGQEKWKQRLKGPVSASPVLAGGHIYWANERGTHYVFKPNPDQVELVAENTLGDESFASPAVSRGQLFFRVTHRIDGKRQEMLYCIGKAK